MLIGMLGGDAYFLSNPPFKCWAPSLSHLPFALSNRGWGNGEEEYYTTDNVAVQNGQLQITAKRETVNGFSYTSGRINSQGLVGFCPGVADSSGKTYSTLKLEVSLQTPAPGLSLVILGGGLSREGGGTAPDCGCQLAC